MKTTTNTLPAGLTIKKLSPTVFEVRFNDKVVGKLGQSKGRFRFFGDTATSWFDDAAAAALALCAHQKVDVEKKDTKKTKIADSAPKADPLAAFNDKVDQWLEENHPEQAGVWGPEFKRVLPTLRTRKRFLKDVTDLELAQAMLDFEVATENRSRQVKHLRSKVNGIARRSGGQTHKQTPAQHLRDLLTDGDLSEFEIAPDGEQPKQLSFLVTDADGIPYRVRLTVRAIECLSDEETDEDDVDGEDEDDNE